MIYKIQSEFFYNTCLSRIMDLITVSGDSDKRTVAKGLLDKYIQRTILHINLVCESSKILADHYCENTGVDKETYFRRISNHDADKLNNEDTVVYYAVACEKVYGTGTEEWDCSQEVIDRWENVEWSKHWERHAHHVPEHFGRKEDVVWRVDTNVDRYALTEMVADWTAMWLELRHKSPSEWLEQEHGKSFILTGGDLDYVSGCCELVEHSENQIAAVASKYNLPTPTHDSQYASESINPIISVESNYPRFLRKRFWFFANNNKTIPEDNGTKIVCSTLQDAYFYVAIKNLVNKKEAKWVAQNDTELAIYCPGETGIKEVTGDIYKLKFDKAQDLYYHGHKGFGNRRTPKLWFIPNQIKDIPEPEYLETVTIKIFFVNSKDDVPSYFPGYENLTDGDFKVIQDSQYAGESIDVGKEWKEDAIHNITTLRTFLSSVKYGFGIDPKDNFKTWKLTTVSDMLKNKIGTCYDTAFVADYFLKKIKNSHKCYFICQKGRTSVLNNRTHTFNLYLDNSGEWRWLEASWGPYKKNNFHSKSEHELVQLIARLHANMCKTAVDVRSITSWPATGCNMEVFVKHMTESSIISTIEPGKIDLKQEENQEQKPQQTQVQKLERAQILKREESESEWDNKNSNESFSFEKLDPEWSTDVAIKKHATDEDVADMKSHIKDYLYHGSPELYNYIQPQTRADTTTPVIFFTPFQYIASLFCINDWHLGKGLYTNKRVRLNGWADNMNKYEGLDEPAVVVDISHNIRDIKDYTVKRTGYIYCVKYDRIADKVYPYNRWSKSQECVYIGDKLRPDRIIKVTQTVKVHYDSKVAREAGGDAIPINQNTSNESFSMESIPAQYQKLVFENNPVKRKIYGMVRGYYEDTGSHGYEHIKEVLTTAYVLKGKKDLDNLEYTTILYHDVGRGFTDKDDEHNIISEKIARRDLPKTHLFTDDELEKIYKAVLWHRSGWRMDNGIEDKDLDPLSELMANADKGFPQTTYYDICLRPTLWILEGRDVVANPEKYERLHRYQSVDDIAQGVKETLERLKAKRFDKNDTSLHARVFAKEKKLQIELSEKMTIEDIKNVVVEIAKNYGYTLPNISTEAYLPFTKTGIFKTIHDRAKKHYRSIGPNSWEHIQQVFSQATRAVKFVDHRDLNPKEFAAILYHDSSCLTDTDKEGHNMRGAEIARQELGDLFVVKDLNEIVVAIQEHDGFTKWSSMTGDVLATGDANPPDAMWILNKSYCWGIRKGLNHKQRIENMVNSIPKKYGSKGTMVYPEHYKKYFSERIKETQVYFDNLTEEVAERDVMAYRKAHNISANSIDMPEPSVESFSFGLTRTFENITSVEDLKQQYKSVGYGVIDYSVKPPIGIPLENIPSMEEFGEKWRLTSPEDLFKYRYGNCVNTAYASDLILTSLNIQHTVYCMFTEDVPGGHMFVVYRDAQNWKWIEASFDQYNNNNLSWSTERAACLDICVKVAKYLNSKKYSVWQFTSFPPEGSGIERLVLLTYIPMIKLHKPVYTNGNGKGLLNWEDQQDVNSSEPGLISRIMNAVGFSTESYSFESESINKQPILIGSSNKAKIAEFREIFDKIGITIITPEDVDGVPDVVENQKTCEANAEKKAREIAKAKHQFTMCDDSGLFVKALNDEPGVHSARYADTDEHNSPAHRRLVLEKLQGNTNRAAVFRTYISLADASGKVIKTVVGELKGTIAAEERGTDGVSYDMIFIPDGYNKTLAELGIDVKNKISHRRKAAELIAKYIKSNKQSIGIERYSVIVSEEDIHHNVEQHIKDNKVYHCSPQKYDKLEIKYMGKWYKDKKGIFVTPFASIASCFIIDKRSILNKLDKEGIDTRDNPINFKYDVWDKKTDELGTMPKHINVTIQGCTGFKPFNGKATGYLYTIDYSKYQDKTSMFEKSETSDVEFIINSDITPEKVEKISVEYTVHPGEAVSHEFLDLTTKKITFPKEEIPTIKKQDRIITTRVSSDYNKFNVGDIVETPWDVLYRVDKRQNITDIKDHPYYKELTEDQIDLLSKYNKIAVLTLMIYKESREAFDASKFKPIHIDKNPSPDRFANDTMKINRIDPSTLNQDIIKVLEKQDEYLEIVRRWLTVPDYSLTPKLIEFGKFVDKLYGFDKEFVAYRAMRIGKSTLPIQQSMGIVDNTEIIKKPKPFVVPGYKFTYMNTGPLSVTRAVWVSKVYGDLIVKTKVRPETSKLVITNELAYVLQALDEKYPYYRPLNLSALTEVLLFPDQTLNYQVVTTNGDILSEMPEFKEMNFKDKKIDLDASMSIGEEALSSVLVDTKTIEAGTESLLISNELLEINHDYILRKLQEGKRCNKQELIDLLQPGDILIPYPKDKNQTNFMKLFHAAERTVYGMSFTSCKLCHEKGIIIGYGVKNKIEKGKSAFDKTTITEFLKHSGGIMVLRTKHPIPPTKLDKLYEFMERYYKDASKHDFSYWDATVGTLSYLTGLFKGEVDPRKMDPEDYNKLVCSSVVAGAFRWADIDIGLPPIKISRIMPIHMTMSEKLKCVGYWFAPGEWNPKIEKQISLLESNESLSTEALSDSEINKRKKSIVDKICRICDIIDPSHTNSDRYHRLLDKMSPKEFNQWMTYVKDGKWVLHIVAPNMIVNLRNDNLLKAADAVGAKLFHRIWMEDNNTGRKFLTDNEYLVLPLPIRRQQQFLDEKMSVPEDDKHIDGMTGQVTGDSKSTQITNPEINILAFRGLDTTLEEMVNVRGGNMVAYGEFRKQAEETGEVHMSELDPTTRSRTAVIAQVLLNAMHIENNIV